MLKRLRTAHPILYCILAEVLFLGSLFFVQSGADRRAGGGRGRFFRSG